jgi:hypothetical protein
MTVHAGGLAVAVAAALVVGFIAGTWAGVAVDAVRDWYYIIRGWFLTALAVCGALAVVWGIAHFGYHKL